jgi:cellulose synthase (UDP-forming)
MWVPDRKRPVITPVVVRSRQGTHHRLEFAARDWPALAAIATTAMGVGALKWGVARGEQQWDPSTLAPA